MLLWPEIGRNERIECGWVSPWEGDLGGLFCPFGTGYHWGDGMCRHADGRSAGGGCGGGCGCGARRDFCHFPMWLF